MQLLEYSCSCFKFLDEVLLYNANLPIIMYILQQKIWAVEQFQCFSWNKPLQQSWGLCDCQLLISFLGCFHCAPHLCILGTPFPALSGGASKNLASFTLTQFKIVSPSSDSSYDSSPFLNWVLGNKLVALAHALQVLSGGVRVTCSGHQLPLIMLKICKFQFVHLIFESHEML